MTDASEQHAPGGWPDADGSAVRVMLLGTYHMANPGEDVVNVDADDVLAADRQSQLRDLTGALADWTPERVAVEVPSDLQATVDALYDEYRTGARTYDEPGSFPEPFPDDFARNEVVQVGFRLADRLGHERVLAVDHPPRAPEPTEEEAMWEVMEAPPDPSTVEYEVPDVDALDAAGDERLRESTVREYHRWINSESRLRTNHALMFSAALEAGPADEEAAVGLLSSWYERNVRTVRTLWRSLDGEDRALLLFGHGHVRVLRHLLEEAPMYRPVSPLPYL